MPSFQHYMGSDITIDAKDVVAVQPSKMPGYTFIIVNWDKHTGYNVKGESNDVMKQLFSQQNPT